MEKRDETLKETLYFNFLFAPQYDILPAVCFKVLLRQVHYVALAVYRDKNRHP